MKIARQFAQTLRSYLPYSGGYPQVVVGEDRLQEFEDEIDAADADAAFRAVIHDLCIANGMRDDDKPYFFLKRVLEEKNSPDIQMICELARACDEGGIQEGEDPVSFIESKCAEVERLTEQLEETQHKLAQSESRYGQDDCVNECMMLHDLYANVSKNFGDLAEVVRSESSSLDKTFRYGLGLLAVAVTFAAMVVASFWK